MERKIFFILLFMFLMIYGQPSNKEAIPYKCGVDSDQTFSEFSYVTPIKNSKFHIDERRLDNDGFKNFNIYLDTCNLEEEMKEYNLTHYSNLFIDSMKKAIETLESLLKVKETGCYYFKDEDMKDIDIHYWDKTKIGTEAFNNSITTCSNNIDLFIFARFGKGNELSNLTLAKAGAKYLDFETGRPIIGLVNINRNVDYSKINSKEYFQSIIIHEFTHILGFSGYFFTNFYHNAFTTIDKFNITRTYINSTKVVETARKYFNCPDLEGVELEDSGGSGTTGSHWEARILLGDYMNGVIYPEEQVISEFTLSLLEDSGYYKANYYTGGLMRYGKNKGCKFVRDKCVNNYEVDPYFENEFYDFYSSTQSISPSCSSGRQSRTYFAVFIKKSIPIYYQYYWNSSYGGFDSADYCPVPREFQNNNRYYVGHCSNKGNGEYGDKIKYIEDNHYKYYISKDFESITGETYSDHSFCFLSSLTKKSEPNFEIYSNFVRAVCYEIYCSPKSLTVKIHDNFIVCPRAGGKIQIDEYKGFFLCPDYNLMCSGTILCNDMFDCVEKQSELKEDSFNYDYNIATTQNIERAKIEDVDEKNNFELSEEGICIKYCKQCKENKKCIKCRDEYGLVGNKTNNELLCLPENELSKGFYKNNESIYYKCIDFCEKCSNDTSCDKCWNNFTLIENICIEEILNCENYYLNGTCKKCIENYAFEGEERNICSNKEMFLNSYYSKDGGISFYSCDGEDNDKHIKNCINCYFNENSLTLECLECKNHYYILDDEFNKCFSENELDSKKYYKINSTHMKTCSNKIEKCNECENGEKCIKCEDNHYFINNDAKKCVNIHEIFPIDEYYLDRNNTTYYSCNNSEYHSIQNCKKCYNNNSCTLCNNGFTFIEGNKTKCFKIKELENKYYPDPNNDINYIGCSNLFNNCYTCNLSQCLTCQEGFIFINDNYSICISISSIYLDEYYTNDNITFYSCKVEKYKNNSKCPISTNSIIYTDFHNINSTNIFKSTTIPNIISTNQIITTNLGDLYSTNRIISTSFLNINSTNPIISTTIPNINSTNPIIFTSISNIISTKLIIPTTFPIINSTNLILTTTIPNINSTNLIIFTTISNINSINPIISTTFANINSTNPIISNTFANINSTNPIISTTFAKINSTNPIISTTFVNFNSTNPIISTTFANFNSTNPIISTTFANFNSTNPIIYTTFANFNSTNPILSTTFTNFNSTNPIISTIFVNFNSTNPIISTTFANFNSTNPIISTTIPYFKSNIRTIFTSIPQVNTKTSKINNSLPKIKKTTHMIFTNIPNINMLNPSTIYILNDSIIKTSFTINNTINSTNIRNNSIEPKITNPKSITTFSYIKTNSPIYSSIISYNNTKTVTIDESDYPLKIYTMFFLQIQLRENKIYVYIICDFDISNNYSITITVVIYIPKILRDLDEYEKKEIELKAIPTNKENQNIFEISADLKDSINTNKKYNVEMKNINVDSKGINNAYYDIILGENNDNKNTQKVEELIKKGGTNFSKIVNKEINNYQISQYKIEDISEGCNFNLKVNKNINSNRNLILTFLESNQNSNNITAECTLSPKNNNEIPCSIDIETSNSYFLKEFIDYNENEIITIISYYKNYTYSIICNNSEKNSKGKTTTLHIVISIILCFILVVFIIVISLLLSKKRRKILPYTKESTIHLPEDMASSSKE